MPFGRAFEQAQTFLDAERGFEPPPRRYQVDHVAGRHELDVVPRLDAELICDALGKRDLELTGDLRHMPYFSKEQILVKGLAGLAHPLMNASSLVSMAVIIT